MNHSPFNIIIDTREKRPWAFPSHLAIVKRGTLPTGDYALENDMLFAIERKSMDDFINSITSKWSSFSNELDRMKSFPARVIIIEGLFSEIIEHKYSSPMSTGYILRRLAELTMDRISVLFADNPLSAAGLCYTILKERLKKL